MSTYTTPRGAIVFPSGRDAVEPSGKRASRLGNPGTMDKIASSRTSSSVV